MTLLKIASREYVCPVCGVESNHQTNHTGEIYCSCKNCGNGVLYFKQDDREFKPMFDLVSYRFDLTKPDEKSAYYEMAARLENDFKFTCFDSHVLPRQAGTFFASLKDSLICVHEPDAFGNQFITNKGRLHQWFEAIYPNVYIREGYYLTPNKKYL